MLMNKVLLMATCSKKILVLGWAPPDKEDVDEQDVVDGDLLQEDLSTWMGTTCSAPPPHNPCCTLSRATAPCSYSALEFIKYLGCVVDADPLVYLVRHGVVEEFLCFE